MVDTTGFNTEHAVLVIDVEEKTITVYNGSVIIVNATYENVNSVGFVVKGLKTTHADLAPRVVYIED